MSLLGGKPKKGKKDDKKQAKEEQKRKEEARKRQEKLDRETAKKAEEERKRKEKDDKENAKKAAGEKKMRAKEAKKRAEERKKAEERKEKEAKKSGKEAAKKAEEKKKGEKKKEEKKKKEKQKKDKGKKEEKEAPKEEKKAEEGAPADEEGEEAARKKPKNPMHVKVMPRFYLKWLERQFRFSGSGKDPAKFARNIVFMSLIISIAVGWFFRRYMLFVTPGVFIVLFGFFNLLILLSVDRRGRFVDEILPDALLLVSANIRAGYIPSRALLLSARKEFGPLAEAIKRSGKEIMSGKSLEEGLKEIPKTIKSDDLKRTIDLIVQGIRGGGQMVSLLEENAIDIRRRQAITKEIKANTMMYAIFIAFAGCLGAPGLYALSSYLAVTMNELTPDMSMSSAISSKVSFIKMGGVSISEEFLLQFSLLAIIITTFFGGLILGLINSGKEKDGLKFAPILTIIALLIFLGARFVISTMFGSMLPG